MENHSRRDALKLLSAAAASTAVATFIPPITSRAARLELKPENDAQLRVLRWKRFVQGDEEQWDRNVARFTKLTGVPVRVDSENFEDIRPKAAVAANVGSGPDIVYGWYDDAHQYPDRVLDVSDIADYLGEKYGGWYEVCRRYGMRDGRWICIPLGFLGGCLVYRQSMIEAAGFPKVPHDVDGFLKLCVALKRKNTPIGFALGNAVGDANAWCHWVVWAHGGKMVDESGNVAINSRETIEALKYSKALYKTMIPGTLSWLDPNNNKAFLAGEISLTLNGISIFYAAKTSPDAGVQVLARDIQHAHLPVGPVGKPTELSPLSPAFIFKHTKFPQTAKDFVRFIMEKEQYEVWQTASLGYVAQPLKAYEANPIWTADPRHTPYRDVPKLLLENGYAGPLGTASATVMADYVMVNMVAEAASGNESPESAAKRAEKRARRYYRRS